ncbi:MAG: sugar phosphate isomerase/epimerase [Clostridia bacterium]|nr:sugar phosphate isomerase/epimerase [Clostridia bacterium]
MNRMTGLSRQANLTAKDFELMQKAGIDCVEISPASEQYDTILDLKKLKEYADEYGIILRSFHHRFGDEYDISSLDENIRRGAVEYYEKFIPECAQVGIKIHIVHASFEPIEDSERENRIEAAKRSLAELVQFAEKYDAVIAVEDLPRSCLGNCSADMLALASADERIRFCFDTNHLLGENIKDFIKATAHKYVSVHFSDYDFINERHWLPGEGDINWCELMDTLDECGYEGPILYELGFKAPWSIVRPRDLTPFDIKRNHIELEGRLELTAIGTRKPKLGMWKQEM